MSGQQRHVPRVALTREEAAESLGMGLTSFKKYVQPYVPVYRQGKLRLFRVADLDAWLAKNSERVLDDAA